MKDLCLIPERVALAAQADGWWVRSLIIWAKPNPMPESVTDRPTDAYEHIILLTKSPHYFWDAEAVNEKCTESTMTRVALAESRKGEADTQSNVAQVKRCESAAVSRDMYANPSDHLVCTPNGGYRNLRNVWTIPTQPYSGAHFATFPEEIPRRAILAGTSSRGACRQCGAPWERILEVQKLTGKLPDYNTKYDKHSQQDGSARMALRRETLRSTTGNHDDYFPEKRTIGWEPTCKCGCAETRPCLVLDPFAGSGTTGRVAIALRRYVVLLDLAYTRSTESDCLKGRQYEKLARRRTTGVQIEAFL